MISNIKNFLEKSNQPKFRLKQIQKAIYQDGIFDFNEMTVLPKNLREELKKEIQFFPFEVEKVLTAKDKKSAKALLKFPDGNFTETVLISPKPGDWSVCVSSQVGCPLGCEFCATGKSGYVRNLTAEEISGQVLFWEKYLIRNPSCVLPLKRGGELGLKINSIVFMGMGESMLNWENVSEAILELHNPEMFGFGWRSLSVSTAGIPEGIEKLANEFPQVNLAISLHFADDEKRSQWMPINRQYNLEKLQEALKKYLQKTNRKIFVEYVMLKGLNDSQEDANKLIKYLKSLRLDQLVHVNLINYNETQGKFQSSSREQIIFFKEYLAKNGVAVTIRKSLGGEIQGACGQLAGKK